MEGLEARTISATSQPVPFFIKPAVQRISSLQDFEGRRTHLSVLATQPPAALSRQEQTTLAKKE
jgi:hypothetical protein